MELILVPEINLKLRTLQRPVMLSEDLRRDINKLQLRQNSVQYHSFSQFCFRTIFYNQHEQIGKESFSYNLNMCRSMLSRVFPEWKCFLKNSAENSVTPQWELNPEPLTFMPYMLLSELTPLFAGSPYVSCSIESEA